MRTADVAAARVPLWPAATASAVLALTAFTAVIAVSAAAAADLASANAVAVGTGQIDHRVLSGDRDAVAIGTRNLGAIALLAGGAATGGMLTVLAIAVLGVGIGWSAAAVVGALGVTETVARISPYIVFEGAAVMIAAVAGLLPGAQALLAAARRQPSPFREYTRALSTSLALAGIAAALIIVAAAVEAIVIGAHTT